MITFLDGEFSQLNTFISDLQPSKIFVLVDENTHHFCLPTLLGNLETEIPLEILEIEAGEEMKTIESTVQLWEILAEFEADRKALLINLGGGVITDLGGFTASTFKRGIRFINIPTTLLGMCDASLGGKTGVDLNHLKNMAGTFALPVQVFLYPDFLQTLPFTELRSGFAEMLKHGLIADKNHWTDLIGIEDLNYEQITPFIERSMSIKQNIIEQDFREQNIRKTLNFGHTVGHAVESLFLQSGKTIPHGEAVALGMIVETHLSFLEKLIDEDTSNHINQYILRFFPSISLTDFSNADILHLMQHDKKNAGKSIRFALIKEIGSSVFDYEVSEKNIDTALDFYKS